MKEQCIDMFIHVILFAAPEQQRIFKCPCYSLKLAVAGGWFIYDLQERKFGNNSVLLDYLSRI